MIFAYRFLRLPWTMVFLLILGPCLSWARAAVDDFRPLLENAVRQGLPEVVIPPGTYRLKPLQGNVHVEIRHAQNLKIIATGVTLICEDLTRALNFENCRNVTLSGLTVDYDPLPFTQGRVIAIAPDFSSIDVRLDAGYPREAYSRIDLCDPKTRFRKRGMPFLWGTRARMIDPQTVRVSRPDIGKAAQVGDLASLSTGQRSGGAPHAIVVASCEGMVFEDVTVHSAPGFGIMETDGEGGMRYTRCRVVPGPRPAGATEDRLLSSSWDAIQSDAMKRGPLIEDCEIRDAGDDSWSVQSGDYLVMAVDGSQAVIALRDEFCAGPMAGDRLARSLDSAQVVIATRREVPLESAGVAADILAKWRSARPWDFWKVSRRALEITVNGPFPFAVGDSVYCPDRQGNGFIFRNNRLHSSGRILIKAAGTIENNQVVDGHSGVTVCPELPVGGAAGITGLVIRGNHFSGTGYFCPSWDSAEAGCISITRGAGNHRFAPPGIFRHVEIENNVFEDVRGPCIVATSVLGLTIQNNIFRDVMTAPPSETGGAFGIDRDALIWLSDCTKVAVTGNRIDQPGSYLLQPLAGSDIDPHVLQAAQAGIELYSGKNDASTTAPVGGNAGKP